MSEFSVNDHLEGILSDFEALKRSFEIDDVDDIPSAPSPIISPGSSHLLLNHNNKANETRGGGGMMMTGVPTSPASSAYGNINNNGNHSSMAYRSRLGLGVGPSPAQSPVLKSRTVGSLGTSLSFNRGTMGKPTFSNNGTGPSGGGVTRAASFQNRFNPNGYSSSSSMLSGGPGSDNDSLHSSSSSLEYSSSSGTMQPPLTKMGSFPSSPPPPSGEYHPHQYQQQQQHLLLAQQRAREMQPQVGGGGGGGVVLGGGNHVLKKFSSHGSVFHSELDDGPGLVLGGGGGGGGGHGSMPSLDLQSGEGGGGGGVRRASGAMSPGLRYGSAAWNGRSHSTAAATTGKESYYNSNSQNHVQPPSPHTPHTPQTPQKAKETPRLHKFPLDLDSLVGSPAGANKPQSGAPSPTPPRPPPRSHYPAGPPSASASPSASLSSLDSASDTTPPLSLHHPLSPLSSPFPPPPASPPGSTPVPEVSCSPVPLSPAQSPQLEQLCGPQAVAVAPGGGPKPAMRPAEDGQGEARESVGSILQRIASFSRPIVVADAGASPAAVAPPPRAPPAAVAPPPRASPAAVAPPPRAPPAAVAAVAPPPRALSNGVKRNAGPALQRQECVAPAETAPPPAPEQRLGKKMHEETAKVSETDTPTAMEEREAEPERAARGEGEEGGGGGGNERESNGQTPATQSAVDTATPVVATSSDQTTPSREKKEENSSEAKVEEEKKKKNDGVTNIEVEVEKEPVIPACRPAPTPGVGVLRGSELFGYVGIEAVLDQMRRKTMKAGFEFNIMVVGQSGLGKSTLVNTLFKSKVSRKSCTPNYEEKISKTVKLQSVSHMIEEKGVKMKLTVIDTPGFGDQINNENCWEPIEKYVNEQYEKYLREELHVNRKRRIPDSRIHCCVYFLPATGHWLRPIDIEFMKRLGKIVSIVPVIAKSDTLTIEERLEFKQRIRQDLVANGIRVYPQKEFDEDTEERMVNDRIRANIPFAVVGTDKEHQVNGNKVLGRKTKWGIIEVENVAHCEFANLRDLLIRSHLQDLKDVTHDIHYETYRVRRLNEGNMTLNGLALATRPLENGTAHNNKSDSESHL